MINIGLVRLLPQQYPKVEANPSQMKMTKQAFLTDFFLITNFCVKIVANTNQKIYWGHID